MADTFDLYVHVTDSIIASIEAGTPAWRKPWTGDKAGAPFPLRSNGEPYSGINVLMLWLAADAKGYRAARWFTTSRPKRQADRCERARNRPPSSNMAPLSARTRKRGRNAACPT